MDSASTKGEFVMGVVTHGGTIPCSCAHCSYCKKLRQIGASNAAFSAHLAEFTEGMAKKPKRKPRKGRCRSHSRFNCNSPGCF